MNSSVPPGSAGQPQLQLATFADPNFNLKALVDSVTFRPLSLVALHATKPDSPVAGGGNTATAQTAFDARPFIKVMEAASDDLVKFRKRIQREIDDLEDVMLASETTYKQKLADMSSAFRKVYQSFDTLEGRVSEVGTTAVRIGEQLETIDKQRAKAADTCELLQYFLDLNRGVTDRLEALRQSADQKTAPTPSASTTTVNAATTTTAASSAPTGAIRVAVLARRLQQIVRDTDMPGTDTARATIDQYCEHLETEMVRQFQVAAEKHDLVGMRHCAQVVTEFNGGESVIKAWINQHPVFTPQASGPRAGARMPSKPDGADPGMARLLEQIRATIYQDWELVSSVFPAPISVLTTLIQRFFQQVVQQYLDQLFKEASDVSDVFYLRAVAANFNAAKTLVKDLKHFDDTVLKKPVIANVVDQCVEELFTLHKATTDHERKHLQTVMDTTFQAAITYYAGRKQVKKGMFGRIQKTSTGALEHLLSMDHLMTVLAAHTASVERCLLLHAQPPPAVAEIYTALAATVYSSYLEAALDAVWDEVQLMDGAKAEPDLKVLATVQAANTLVQLMQVHFEQLMVPVLVAVPSVHRQVVEEKNRRIDRLEARMGTILAHLVTAATAHSQLLLSKQKRADFRIRDDSMDLVAHQIASPTCVAMCEFLGRLLGHVQSFLDGANVKAFLLEIGVQVHAQLLEHFKKFPVSTTGALTLSRDIAKYQEAITAFKVDQLGPRFDLLREIGNLFLVRPENLSSILDEGLLASLDSSLLGAYLINRADYRSAKIDAMLRQRIATEQHAAGRGRRGGEDEDDVGSSLTSFAASSAYDAVGSGHEGLSRGGIQGSVLSLRG
ncbi:Exocyst complex component 5 [Allomyces arbusculus]|nr:Exocyst complex component 5 [Allomyces arbusculus]